MKDTVRDVTRDLTDPLERPEAQPDHQPTQHDERDDQPAADQRLDENQPLERLIHLAQGNSDDQGASAAHGERRDAITQARPCLRVHGGQSDRRRET